ncbi:MAG TPA: FeoB-associated Cys-rich membrane protein [Candidatus Acidoferrum sp.]|nr:FeoB-associated Cys-rich membrane protein [Candidatus Acidoferrum sp.]
MLAFITENFATIVISLALLAVVAGIVAKLYRNWKTGKTSCGCGCEGCPMGGACHEKK